MRDFTHLHVHTHYSLKDAITTSDQLARFAKADGAPALALTDHGNLAGAIEHYRACKEHGIKPILGCEIYLATRTIEEGGRAEGNKTSHLTVLAKNNTGWSNLMKILSHAHLNGMWGGKPRCDKAFLREHSEGLVALSGCQSSQISREIMADDLVAAEKSIEEFQSIFGKDNFFLEIMRIANPRQEMIEKGVLELHKKTAVPLVATNDIHWPCKGDEDVHDTLICLQGDSYKDQINRMRYDTNQLFYKTSAEMRHLFREHTVACDNTLMISEMIDISLDLDNYKIPKWNDPEKLSSKRRFEKELEKGLLHFYGDNQEARDRLGYEKSVIEKMGFTDYFLIVWDIVRFCKENNIPTGPGRGSAAGSIVSYCLGVTEIDPLKYDLLFERFLNPDRISMPDIDLDVCQIRRSEVITYLRSKYGNECVAKIGTIARMLAKGVVNEVGKRLRTPPNILSDIARRIPEGPGVTLAKAIANDPELQQLKEQNEEFFKHAMGLEGKPIHTSSHAAGIVLSDRPLEEIVPLSREKSKNNQGAIITQFPMEDVEAVGLLKMDLLGLKTLSIIYECARLIEMKHGRPMIDTITTSKLLDDPKVYEDIFKNGDTLGVFQFESSGMRAYLRSMKADQFNDCVAMNALYRPGPIQGGMVDKYIKRKLGQEEVEYIDERAAKILQPTFGLMIYQEQIMRMANVLAGYSIAEADILRKLIGKKIPEKLALQKDKFVEGCVENSLPREKAEIIFQEINAFGDYGFNKSHSVGYSAISYMCAWFKTYYRKEFMAANMTLEAQSDGKLQEFMTECVDNKIQLLPPCINTSHVECVVENEAIRIGVHKIKGIGKSVAETLITQRPPEGYRSLAEIALVLDNE